MVSRAWLGLGGPYRHLRRERLPDEVLTSTDQPWSPRSSRERVPTASVTVAALRARNPLHGHGYSACVRAVRRDEPSHTAREWVADTFQDTPNESSAEYDSAPMSCSSLMSSAADMLFTSLHRSRDITV